MNEALPSVTRRRRTFGSRRAVVLLGLVLVVLAVAGFSRYALGGAKEMFAKYEKECLDKGWKRFTMTVGGLERQVLWKAPDGGTWSRGVIVALHGGGGTYSNYCANLSIGQPMVDFSDMALKAGYAVFSPDSTDTLAKDDAGNACGKRWDSLDHKGGENQDVAFIRELITRTIPGLRPPASHSQVYLVGISNGGFMTILASTQMPDLITAFAPVSAGDPYSTALECSKKNSSMLRQTPGIFVDRGTGKSIADDASCGRATGASIALPKGARPPFMFLYHQLDGGVDLSCKKKAIERLTGFGFPETPPFIIKSSGRKSVFKHLWQDEYNAPLLKFLESPPAGVSAVAPGADNVAPEAAPGHCADPDPVSTNEG